MGGHASGMTRVRSRSTPARRRQAAEQKARPSCRRSLERLEHLGVHCPDFDQLIDPYARTFLADLLALG